MTPDLLREAGQALHGERWQVPLSRDLGLSDRTMRYWIAGEVGIPSGIQAELADLLRAKGAALRSVLAKLR